jgi:autotransporter-associated beta strand protein
MQTKIKIIFFIATFLLSLPQFICGKTITITSSNPANTAAYLSQGGTNYFIYKASLNVSNEWNSYGASFTQFQFVVNGTFSPSDIIYTSGASGYKLWMNTTDDFSTASLQSNPVSAVTAGNTVTITTYNPWLNPGQTYYMWITADISSAATVGHTLTVAAPSSSNFALNNGYSITTSLYSGGTQTISPPKQFRSIASGKWNSLSTWQESVDNGATWFTATTIPSNSDDAITIRNGNTVTITNNVATDQTTIDNGGQITVSTGASLTVADGAGTDLTVNGYLLNQGAVSQSGSITFNSGSTYQHDIDGGTIPSATWDANSTCLITGISYSTPSGLAQSFGNFTWNCTGQSTDLSLAGNLTTVNGNLTISNTGSSSSLRLLNSSNAANTLNIAGNFIQTGGILYIYGTSTSYTGGSEIVNIGGSFNLSGGTLNINGRSSDYGASGIINVNGNFTLSGGTLTETGVGAADINFSGNTTQVFNKSAGTIANTINFSILSGATVDFGTSVLDGTLATFTLNSEGTIITANTAGISKSGTNSGSIQVRGSRTYSTGANYVYNGTAGQATGNGWTKANNLTIIGGSTKTLTANSTLNGTLTIDNGNTLSNNTITLNGDIIVTASNNNPNGAIINSDVSLSSSITINVTDSSPTYDLTINGDISGSNGLTKTGNGTILLNGNNSYSSTTTISAGTVSLGNTNAIANSAPVTMNGGTLAAGYSETAGTLTLTDNSTIAMGTNTMNLKFSRSDSKAWTAGKILTITGWQGNWDGSAGTIERLYIGTSTSGLTSSQLSQITFFNSADNTYHDAQIISGGEIVPKSSIKTPSITVSPSSASFIEVVGYTSTSQFTTITGKYLANAITVTAPAAYQLSTDNSTWSSSGGNITLDKNGGTLYIRYAPTSVESSITATFTITSGSTTQTFTTTGTAYQNAVYVRQNGRGNKDGTSWTNAMSTVQNAIETSLTLSSLLPVYVAAGSYTSDPNYTSGDYAKYSSGYWQGWTNNFVIRSGVNVYGSFPEYATTNNNNADMTSRVVLSKATQYATTLNGSNDIRVLGPTFASTPLAGGTGLAAPTTWDGFILTGANMQTCASGRDDACGAGVYTLPNFTLSNSIIESNSTSGNTTNDGAGAEMDGGTLYNCIIRNNNTGALNVNNSNAGTINIRGGGSNVINCLVYGNYAYYAGGGMSINLSSNYSIPCYIINNTIVSNTASNRSSGIHIFGSNEMFYFYNNAVWNNSVSGVIADNEKNNAWPSGHGSTLGSGSMILDASNTTPATSGSTYFPKFTNPTTDNTANYRPLTASSLINAGSNSVSGAPAFPTTDIRGIARNGAYDIGCYERAAIYYFVNNASTNSTPNGLSWATPYKTIQDALDMYNTGDSTQIWVATGSGSYRPSKNSSGASSTGSDATFLLKPDLGIYGGFAGTPGSEPTNDADAHTKINARLLKQYSTTITSNATASTSLISYASATGSKGAIVDGFTITGAGSGNYAVVIDNAKIQNCKIISNAGGGLSLNNGSSAYNVLIANNGNHGVNFAGTPNNASVINATITNNTGAALVSSTTTPTVKNSIIWKNSGGNISGSTPTISNSAGTSNYSSSTWTSGSGNIDLGERSPNFKNPSAKNYELLLISPCLDGGDATANSLPMDLNGNARKYNNKVDMGAFQKWDGLTIDGSYSAYTIKNIRKGYVVPITKLTASNDTTEILINKGTKFDMAGNTNLKTKWLEIKDSTIVNSFLNPPMITNGSITADSVLYVRSFPLFVTGSTTVHAWNFFGVPYPVSVGKLDGATPESSVRIQQYSESTRATNGMNKSAWINLSTSSLLSTGTGYSLNLNAIKLPYRQTIIFPSNGGSVILSNPATVTVSGLSYTPGSISWKENGWNFISNPYPQSAYIKYQSLPDNTYWPGTMTSGNLAGGYARGVFMYNSDGDYYDIWTLSDFQDAGISPFGACFIKNGNASPTLTKVQFVPEPISSLTSGSLRTRSLADAAPSDSPTQFRLDINGNNTSSRTYVLFHPNTSSDATELEDVPNWSATSNGKNIAINTFGSNSNIALGINTQPFKGIVTTVPLQVSVPATGNYTISLPQKSDTVDVYIKDNTGTVTNLNTTPYSFSVANASSSSNFTLLFKRSNVTPEENSSGITIVQNRTNVSIFNPDVINRIFVYTPAGQLYKERDVNNNQLSFDLPSISGVYLVKIITDKGTFTKKVVNP